MLITIVIIVNSNNDNNNACLKENAGAECVYNQEVVPKIVKIMKVEKNQKIRYFFVTFNEP